MAEQIDLANQLMEAGEDELSLISQPRFSFTAEGISFIFLPEFRPFAKEVEMGCVVTVEKEEGVFYYPALSQVEFSLDDFSSFSMTFTNRARLDDFGYTIADLISSSSSTSNTINNNWSNLMKYVNQEEELKSIITNPLEETFTMATNNAVLQEFTINERGIWGRKYTDDTKSTFAKEQLRMTNNILMFTDDDWASIRTAIGKVSVGGEEYYGLIGEAVVGDLIFGQKLHIVNDTNTISMSSDGLVIQNGEEKIFYVDEEGNLKIDADGTFTGEISGEFSGTLNDATGSYSGSLNDATGTYRGYHYVSEISMDEDGLTILNSGGIRIYTNAVYATDSDGNYIIDSTTGKKVLYDADTTHIATPVFWADAEGNLRLTGEITAMAGDTYEEKFVTIDENGLTIASCGGIQIYDGTVGDTHRVFYADKDGNLTLNGYINADGGTIAGFDIKSVDSAERALTEDDFDISVYWQVGDFDCYVTPKSNIIIASKTTVNIYVNRVLDGATTRLTFTVTFEEGATGTGWDGMGTECDSFTYSVAVSGTGYEVPKKYLSSNKAAYDDTNSGVYLGTDGIGLGIISDDEGGDSTGFYVAENGEMMATQATIRGVGTFGTCNVYEKFDCSNAETCMNSPSISGSILLDNSIELSTQKGNGGSTYFFSIGAINNKEAYQADRQSNHKYTFTVYSWVGDSVSQAPTESVTLKVVLRKGDSKYSDTTPYSIIFPKGKTKEDFTLDWGKSATGSRYVYFYNEQNKSDETNTTTSVSLGAKNSFVCNGNIIPFVDANTPSYSYTLGIEGCEWEYVYANGAGFMSAKIGDLEITENTVMATGAEVLQ